jgi:uncharacterized membrane protein
MVTCSAVFLKEDHFMASNNGSTEWRQIAQALGWFSIGLGLAQVIAPRQLARAIGVKERPILFRLLGMREIASGMGILGRNKQAGWVGSRVAGDLMDLGLLGAAAMINPKSRGKIAVAASAVAGVSVLDAVCTQKLATAGGNGIRVSRSVIIDRSAEELYEFWRNFENLPRFMPHLESVQVLDEKRSRWTAVGPLKVKLKWDAEIVEDRPGELIAWESLQGADVENSGTVRFERAPGGRGTVIRVKLEYNPPGGAAGAAAAKLFGQAPDQQLAIDLRQCKQLIETGEIARTEGQPAGRAKSTSTKYDTLVRH